MITKLQYVESLIRTVGHFTGTHKASHLLGVSHDAVTDYLQGERLTARKLWERVRGLIHDSPKSFRIADDSVQDQRDSRVIEWVRRQYRSTEHGLVRGSGVVNLVHSSGAEGDLYPMDYRLYPPFADGKTQNEQFRERLVQAVAHKRIQAKTVLMDSW